MAAPRPYPDDHALARRFRVSLYADRPPPGMPSTCHAPLEAILRPGATFVHVAPVPRPIIFILSKAATFLGMAATFLIWQPPSSYGR